MTRVLIVGGSFAGLNAAFELRRRVGGEAEITVISKSPEFLFIPSLIWVVPGRRAPRRLTFPLAPLLQRRGIAFRQATVTGFDPERNIVLADGAELPYDYLVVATGPRYDWEAVPGLGPEAGTTWGVYDLDHAMQAARAWASFLHHPGPVVFGATQMASHFGPEYEVVLNMEEALRRAKVRDEVDVTFITPEPYVGHLGVGGVGRSRAALEQLFERRHITAITNVATVGVESGLIHLSDGRSIAHDYAIVTPPYKGIEAIGNTPGLGDEDDFIPVNDRYQHARWPNLYAAGVTVRVEQPEQTPVPVGVPKTGWMSEMMAKTAAYNIAADMRGTQMIERPFPQMQLQYLLDAGSDGVIILADHVFPPRRRERVISGPWAHWSKLAFERYYMTKMRHGLTQLP